jgi:hypothetical protein
MIFHSAPKDQDVEDWKKEKHLKKTFESIIHQM